MQEKIQRRKQNRLPEYDYSQAGVYYITICTHERQKILSDIVGDGFPVPKPIGRIAEEWIRQISVHYPEASVDQQVIMPDHIHLLLRIRGTGNPSPTIGSVIGWYKYQVTKQVNLFCNTPGRRLFQRSYFDHVVRDQRDYNEIWEYIENNPRKWVMQKQGGEG